MFTWDVFIHPTKYHDMSFLEIHNVKIKGISACVPSRVEETKDYSLMTEEEIQKYISSTVLKYSKSTLIFDGVTPYLVVSHNQ